MICAYYPLIDYSIPNFILAPETIAALRQNGTSPINWRRRCHLQATVGPLTRPILNRLLTILEISFGIRNGIGRSKWILQRLVTINSLLLWSRLWRQKSRIWQSKGVVRAYPLKCKEIVQPLHLRSIIMPNGSPLPSRD